MPAPAAVPGFAAGVWLACFGLLIFATCILLSSVASRKLDSNSGALLAAAVTVPLGLLLVAVQSLAGRPWSTPTVWGMAAFAISGIFSTYLGRWLFFRSIETIGPSRASAFQTSMPVATACIGWLALGETLGLLAIAGMALAIFGLLVMNQGRRPSPVDTPLKPPPGITTALSIGAGSALAYAVGHVLRGAAVRDWDEPLIGATLGAAAGFLFLLAMSSGHFASTRQRILAQPGSALIYCAIGSLQLIAQVLTIMAMKTLPVSVVILIVSCTPVVVMPVSVFWMRNSEQVGVPAVLGILATIAGVAMVTVSWQA